MRSFKSFGIAAILFSLSLFIISCGNSGHSHDGDADHTHEHADHDGDGHDHDGEGHDHDGEEHSHGEAAVHGEGAAYTAAYVCPMHCEGSGSETEGKCPVCNMNYVAQADHTKDGHTH